MAARESRYKHCAPPERRLMTFANFLKPVRVSPYTGSSQARKSCRHSTRVVIYSCVPRKLSYTRTRHAWATAYRKFTQIWKSRKVRDTLVCDEHAPFKGNRL